MILFHLPFPQSSLYRDGQNSKHFFFVIPGLTRNPGAFSYFKDTGCRIKSGMTISD
jgi:hypothetical protein